MLYEWFRNNKTGHPVVNMPGGSGKSVVIASVAKDALQKWPETKVLMIVHSKELIAQNAEKLRTMWPNAPLGVYSASLKSKTIDAITYAGIQSIRNKAAMIGHVDLIIVDEAHAISAKDEGVYREIINNLETINPNVRVIGFSASPYRLGHGLITEGDAALFTDIIEPVTIEELIYKGHLFPLRSKTTDKKLDPSGIKKRGGEYIASDMERKYNTFENNHDVVSEVMRRAAGYRHILVFCSGIDHSEDVAQAFRDAGVSATSLTSKDNAERDKKLSEFQNGTVRVMCNVGILTTGYDFPNLDCIVFLRSTQSPGLYLQMAVRGMRPKSHTDHCLVLDFAGVVETHGPITAVNPKKPSGKGEGEAPVKVCDNCNELNHISAKECVACGEPFPAPKPIKHKLHDDDIMGLDTTEMNVTEWQWRRHISRASGKEMLMVTYYGALSDKPVNEYLTVMHEGYAGQKARVSLVKIASNAGVHGVTFDGTLDGVAHDMNQATPPALIKFRQDGKFYRVTDRRWG